MKHRKTPEAVITAYTPPTRRRPSATVKVACPFCVQLDRRGRKTDVPGQHLHGLGGAGQSPALGGRAGDCIPDRLRKGADRGVYLLTDPDHLVPDVLTIEQVTA